MVDLQKTPGSRRARPLRNVPPPAAQDRLNIPGSRQRGEIAENLPPAAQDRISRAQRGLDGLEARQAQEPAYALGNGDDRRHRRHSEIEEGGDNQIRDLVVMVS